MPAECVEAGCAAPKHPKAGYGMCHTHYWRAYRAKNRQRLDANYKAWRNERGSRWKGMSKDERDRHRLMSLTRRSARRRAHLFVVTDEDLRRTLVRFGGRCAYCTKRLQGVQWDHVIPLSADGRHSIGNLVPACEDCNKSKGSATVMEWRLSLLRGTPVPRRRYAGSRVPAHQQLALSHPSTEGAA